MEHDHGKAHTDPVAIPTTGALHSVLDLFFPGFGVFAEPARQHWGFDLGQYVHIALGIAIALYAWSLVRDVLLGSLKTIFFSTAEIPPDDEIYVRLTSPPPIVLHDPSHLPLPTPAARQPN
jgi:hypothetical protein